MSISEALDILDSRGTARRFRELLNPLGPDYDARFGPLVIAMASESPAAPAPSRFDPEPGVTPEFMAQVRRKCCGG